MSILSHDHRFLFLHIAKTGGRSVNLTLARHCPRLARFNTKKLNPEVDVLGRRPGLEIRQHMTDSEWNDYFKFAFVRNPWDRAVSMYRHIRSAEEMRSDGKLRYLEEITRRLNIDSQSLTFGTFVKAVLRDRIFDNYHWDKQILSLTDNAGKQMFDFVGRFENLQTDFDTICRRIGFPLARLPHHNKTRRKHYAEYYTDETREIVASIYRDDIDTFGYQFDDAPADLTGGGQPAAAHERLLSRLIFHGRESLRWLNASRQRPALLPSAAGRVQAASEENVSGS